MRRIVVIIALTLFLKPVFPVIEYIVNYDYIAKVLCVNKDKPMMHCNGKCHLMKQLAKEAENEKPIVPNKKGSVQETEMVFCLYGPTFELPKIYFNSIPKINTYYADFYDYAATLSVFHPPAV
ncbi:hypothetical protein [Flavobacterium sp. XGLA_31]|uniref:hypothetical protein n=1 Tax=Flavobacterium sp. XGLA_31 TaxID=3447666 RepID=UPI003F346B29